VAVLVALVTLLTVYKHLPVSLQSGDLPLTEANEKARANPRHGGARKMKGRLTIIALAGAAALALSGVGYGLSTAIIIGTSGNDTLVGTPMRDAIYAKAGDDYAAGRGAGDLIQSGPGNDEAWGNDGNDVVEGNEGDDKLHGGAGNDVVQGGPGDDTARGGADGDVVYGGPGNDRVWVGQGRDRQYGGPGDDVMHALADDNQFDFIDCGDGEDTAWLSQKEHGLYRVVDCEVVKIVVPTREEEAEDEAE